MVAFTEAGLIEPAIEKFRLEEIGKSYEKLEKGQIAEHAVLVP